VPYAVFTDPAIFAREQARIYRGPTWHFLALEDEINEPGAFKSTYIGTTPVVVTRTRDGEVAAWVNRCAHRGALVCRQARGKGHVHRCVYHQWTYDERGRLRGERERRKLDAIDRGCDLRLGRGDLGGGGLLRRRRLGDDGDVRASAGGHEGHIVGGEFGAEPRARVRREGGCVAHVTDARANVWMGGESTGHDPSTSPSRSCRIMDHDTLGANPTIGFIVRFVHSGGLQHTV